MNPVRRHGTAIIGPSRPPQMMQAISFATAAARAAGNIIRTCLQLSGVEPEPSPFSQTSSTAPTISSMRVTADSSSACLG